MPVPLPLPKIAGGNPRTRLSRDCGIATLSPKGARAEVWLFSCSIVKLVHTSRQILVMTEDRPLSAWTAVRRPGRWLVLPLALLVCCLSSLTPESARASGGRSLAQPVSDPRELLRQLNNATIDPSQVYALRDAQITRDRIRIYFNRGFVGFLKQSMGETNGAVFAGDGEVLLTPPTALEKLSLSHFTQTPILEERFTMAYLRFTDATAKDLLAQAHPPDPDSIEQPTGFTEQWDPAVLRRNPYYSTRVLQDLLGDRSRPYFHVQIRGVNLGV